MRSTKMQALQDAVNRAKDVAALPDLKIVSSKEKEIHDKLFISYQESYGRLVKLKAAMKDKEININTMGEQKMHLSKTKAEEEKSLNETVQRIKKLEEEEKRLDRQREVIIDERDRLKELRDSAVELEAMVRLGVAVSRIRWDMTSDPTHVKGFIIKDDDVGCFNLDASKNSPVQIADHIWGMLANYDATGVVSDVIAV